MQDPSASAQSLDQFAEIAQAYCEAFEAYQRQASQRFLSEMLPLVGRLYAAGLALPSLPELDDHDAGEDEDELAPSWLSAITLERTTDPDRMTHDDWWPLYKALSAYLGARNYYREIFDPYEPVSEKEVTGSLADDLADIYRDLLSGCRKWSRGERTGAHWEWRFGLESHWGEHATGAIRAIHCLAAWHDLGWPADTGAV